MKNRNCLCLHCSRISTVGLGDGGELERIACPQCGQARLVLLPEGVFSGGT